MTLQQLRFMVEIVRNQFSITQAAIVLHTSQPAISKQVRLLEQELQIQLFRRVGKRLVDLTAEGKKVFSYAERILTDSANIRHVGEEFISDSQGGLTISTTPTLASYILPMAVKHFKEKYPDVRLHIVVGESDQSVATLVSGEADISIVPRLEGIPKEHAKFRCFHWKRSLIALPDCPLLIAKKITLEMLAEYPIIAFETPAVSLKSIFTANGLSPTYAITTSNPEVMKAYVSLGMGIGIIASATYNKEKDAPLVARDVSKLIKGIDILAIVPRRAYLRSYTYEFIALIAPHLKQKKITDELLRMNFN